MINRNGVHLPDTTYGGNPIDWNCSSDSDDSLQRLKAENAKLRKLVRELWTYAEQELLCDENCSYGAVCDWRDCVFERRMRELGVEVDW